MNYVIDNTIADPVDATGYTVGDKFLVPATGGEGDWAGHQDQIATWNGAVWGFSEPATNAEYQVRDGPNAGRIYTRSATVASTTSIIEDSDMAADPFDFAQWTRVETAGGTALWAAGALTLESTTTGDAAKALAEFTLVPGVLYRLVFVLDTVTTVPPDSLCQWKLRDEVNAVDEDSGNISVAGETEVEFTAVGDTYSFYVQAISSAAEAAQVIVSSVALYRVAEHVVDGGFPDFTNWTEVTPWAIASGYPAPFSGNLAEAILEAADHPYSSFPALQQIVDGLVDGWWYQIDFDVAGIWAEGTLSVAIDGEIIYDCTTNGHHTVYFKALDVDHQLQFPITYFGAPEDFEVQLDNVHWQAALWVPGLMLRASVQGTGSATAILSTSKRLAAVVGSVSSQTSAVVRDRSLAAVVGAGSIPFVTVTKSHVWNLQADVTGLSSANGGASHSPQLAANVGGTLTASLTLTDLGYYTVLMAVRSILSLWTDLGCPCYADGACSPIELDALDRLNAAIQKLSGAGQNFAWISTVALSLTPETGETHIVLPREVIHVKRVEFKPSLSVDNDTFGTFALRPLKSRNELESFRLAYAMGDWPLEAAEEYLTGLRLPLGYFVEAEDPRDDIGGGPPELRLLLAPDFTAAVQWSVALQVAVLPGRLTCGDLRDGSKLPVPHRFAESLVLPLARYYALSSRYFRKPELRESVIEQARDALTLIGEFQPLQPEAAKAPATPLSSAAR